MISFIRKFENVALIGMLAVFGVLCMASNSFGQGSTWTQKADMPTARLGHSSCVLDGKIYAIGGSGNNLSGAAYKILEVYDPIKFWATKADMATRRSQFATCALEGKIYAIGGGGNFYYNPINTIEEYDPVTDTWTHTTDMPRARMGLTASVVNGKIYIIGGADFYETPIAEVYVYDPVTDTWTTGTDLPTPRSHLAAAVLNGKIYAISGTVGPSGNYASLSQVEEYNPATDTWTPKADIITGRRYFNACALNGKIYVFGGTSGSGADGLSSVEEYDPATDTWSEKENMPSGLAGASAVSFDGKVYVSGGAATYPPTVLSTMYEYDPLLDPTGIDVESSEVLVPQEVTLAQNYPNPFNPSTYISFNLQKNCHVNLRVYDILGKLVSTLVDQDMNTGHYKIEFNADNMASGIYLYRIQTNDYTTKKKMILGR